MRKPNLLIVGAAKSGTTYLYDILKNHPDIFFPDIKEPKFFTSEHYTGRLGGPLDHRYTQSVVKSWPSYLALFQNSLESTRIIAEASADYLYYYKTSIPNIIQRLGNPKIIIVIRNPVDRAFSAYNHLKRDIREKLSFKEALAAEDNRIKENYEFLWHYKKAGLYSNSVNQFCTEFTDVKVIIFEELIKNQSIILKEIYDFLEVDFHPIMKMSKSNASGNRKHPYLYTLKETIKRIGIGPIKLPKRVSAYINRIEKAEPIDNSLKRELNAYYEEDIKLLSIIIKKDLSEIWKIKK